MSNDVVSQRVTDKTAVLRIHSTSVDAASAAAIRAACIASMRPVTVLDFSDVAFINSAGISALLEFAVAARTAEYALFALHVSPHHQKIFQKVEMSRFMPIISEADLAQQH